MSSPITRSGEIIPLEIRSIISNRYCTVTRAINHEFWNSNSETQNSIYVGSYGRGTAIDSSDIDILVELPQGEYNRYDFLKGNGQSRLLQAVKNAILITYPRSNVRADGQVVVIDFSDGMKFEVLPAFRNSNFYGNWDGSYIYPDTNMGGNWKSTSPKTEQAAMKQKNSSSNGLLFDTCKHFRRIRNNYFSSYQLSGIVIDSFLFSAIGEWRWLNDGESSQNASGEYERSLLNSLNIDEIFWSGYTPLTAPGSGQKVEIRNNADCLRKVVNFIAN